MRLTEKGRLLRWDGVFGMRVVKFARDHPFVYPDRGRVNLFNLIVVSMVLLT